MEFKGVRYQSHDEVPVLLWRIQGTEYDTANQAKFAAAKLFCNVTGVRVKRLSNGKFGLMFWRGK